MTISSVKSRFPSVTLTRHDLRQCDDAKALARGYAVVWLRHAIAWLKQSDDSSANDQH